VNAESEFFFQICPNPKFSICPDEDDEDDVFDLAKDLGKSKLMIFILLHSKTEKLREQTGESTEINMKIVSKKREGHRRSPLFKEIHEESFLRNVNFKTNVFQQVINVLDEYNFLCICSSRNEKVGQM